MKTVSIAVASAMLITGAAQAATLVDEIDRRSRLVDNSSVGGNWSFDGYQGSGSVVQVDVTILAETVGTFGVVNNSSQDQSYTAGIGTSSGFFAFFLSGPAFPTVTTGASISGTIEPFESLFVAESSSDVANFTFVGAGITRFLSPFKIDYFTLEDVVARGPNVSIRFIDFVNSVSTEVAYSIDDGVTPVPLPSALPMLLAGLCGFGYVARRRQRGFET